MGSDKKEMINHPDHYGGKENPYEAIKVIEAWDLGFCLGNTVKYISRAGKKDAVLQELKKAAWYLQREIEKLTPTEKDLPMENKINFEDMVKTLAKDGDTIANELNGNQAHVLHMAIGISGESGELLDAIKKVAIYRKDIDFENVIEELGDIEFYMEGIRQGLGITRQETIEANINKLGKRYEGFKYSDNAAQERADKPEGQ